MKLVIGTRGSDLALTQTRSVAALLRGLPAVSEVEIRVIKTSGDRIQNTALSEVTGTTDERKGFFTKELEDALLSRSIDLAVHSYKDLPTADVPGLTIGAIPERVGARDVLVLRTGARVREDAPFIAPGSAIGTASVRRMALVACLWPDVRTVPLRGNLPTRLIRLREGRAPNLENPDAPPLPIQAILLAEAGVARLRESGLFERGEHAGLLDGLTFIPLETELFPPAPAQGALAIQCRSNDQTTCEILSSLHDSKVERWIRVERRVLEALEGGCHLPLGIACALQLPREKFQQTELRVDVFLGAQAADNRFGRPVRLTRYAGNTEDAARSLAERVVSEITRQLPVVFTGRSERAEELAHRFPIVPLPLIEIEELSPSEARLAELRTWCELGSGAGDGEFLALFSTPGATAFAKLLGQTNIRLPAGIRLAVTGERTAACAARLFPNLEIAARSPNGTGEALAEVLVGLGAKRILSVAAERGRPEFGERLAREKKECLTLQLYRTKRRTPDLAALSALPSPCFVVLGSPSGVDAFLDALQQSPSLDATGFAPCAIGPTTAARLRERGMAPYAVSEEADYETLLEELIHLPLVRP